MFKDFEKNPIKPSLCAGFSGKWYAAAFPESWNELDVVDVYCYMSMCCEDVADVLFVAMFNNGVTKSKTVQCKMLCKSGELLMFEGLDDGEKSLYSMKCYQNNEILVLYDVNNNVICVMTKILPFDYSICDVLLENNWRDDFVLSDLYD